MKRLLSVLLAALWLLPAVPVRAAAAGAPAMTAQDLQTFYDGLFPYALHRAGIPGGVIVIVKDGKILFAKGYGYANVAKKTPVDPNNTLFRPGSVSKLFTWTAVMQLVQAGKIDLDADVNKYIDFTIPPYDGKPITMRNLMTHTPGFEETVRELLVNTKEQVLPIDVYLKRHLPSRIFPPGQVIAYSNYGATLAGYIVQRVSGEKFEDYIAKHIFEPLRMAHSTFVQPLPANLLPLMANGYVDGEVKPFEYIDTAPAGSSTSSGIDMAHFMLAYLNGGTFEGYQLLKPATIKEMWTPQVPEEKGLPGFDLGFYEDDFNGLTIVGHGGDTIAFHSDLHLIPAKNVGFFVAFNSPGKEGAVEDVRNNLFKAFLDRYFPFTPPHEATVPDPQKDAARVAGYYVSSRRDARALAFVYALAQSQVTANADGTLEVSSLKDAAGDPMKWREVGPLRYREVDGQSHLVFGTDENGNVISWAADVSNMVSVEQRVNGLGTMGALKTGITIFVAIIVLSLLIRLGAWIARRRLKLSLNLSRGENIVHAVARIGAIAFLVALIGWPMLLSNEANLLSSSLPGKMMVLYVIGVIAIIGAFAMVAEAAIRVARGPGGWFVRLGEIVVALAGLYGIWLFVHLQLVNFVTNFYEHHPHERTCYSRDVGTAGRVEPPGQPGLGSDCTRGECTGSSRTCKSCTRDDRARSRRILRRHDAVRAQARRHCRRYARHRERRQDSLRTWIRLRRSEETHAGHSYTDDVPSGIDLEAFHVDLGHAIGAGRKDRSRWRREPVPGFQD
jgi:CubicO group peptidase (beta-lactamase class C family)